MSRILRSYTISKCNELKSSQETSITDTEQDSASLDEYDDLEVDESTYDDELAPTDFDADDESSNSGEESDNQDEYYSPDGNFKWKRNHSDIESSSIRSTGFFSGLLFPVLGFVEIVDFFCYLIDDTMLNHIIQCTNDRYEANLCLDELK